MLRQHGAKHSRHFEHAAALLQARCAAALVRAKIQPAAKVLVPWAREALLSREGEEVCMEETIHNHTRSTL